MARKLSIIHFFDGKSFIIALAIGLFFVYITAPEPEIIYVYPNPDNVNTILYKDKSDTCYKYSGRKVTCPKRKSKIMKYPIQGGIKSPITSLPFK